MPRWNERRFSIAQPIKQRRSPMQVKEQSAPIVGVFDFEVFGSSRDGRQRSSKFQVHCDAIGLNGNEILLLSVAGPETSVKALTAGLRSSGESQNRIALSVHVGEVEANYLTRCPEGYRFYRTKLDYDLWHVLVLANRQGFMPVMNEDALWHVLQTNQFTTPLIREWTPWLYQTMKERDLITELTQCGCQAGLLVADSDDLDKLVSEGIKNGYLSICGRTATRHREKPAIEKDIKNLDQYMLAYGAMLGKQAERSLDPLHVPNRDPLPA